MKAEILKLLLPVRARLERFTRHQLALLPELLLLLLCDDELEPKPLRETLLLDGAEAKNGGVYDTILRDPAQGTEGAE